MTGAWQGAPRSEEVRKRERSGFLMKYADAGVNIAVADDAKQRIRHHASRTFTPGVLGGIVGLRGGFSLAPPKEGESPLVAPSDDGGIHLQSAPGMEELSPIL